MTTAITAGKWNIRIDKVLEYSAESHILEDTEVLLEDAEYFIGATISCVGNLRQPSEMLADGGTHGRPGAMFYRTNLQPTNCTWMVAIYVSAFPSDQTLKPAFKVFTRSYDSGWLPFTTFGDLKAKIAEQLSEIVAAASSIHRTGGYAASATTAALPSGPAEEALATSSSNLATASSSSLLEEKGGIKSVGIPRSGGAEVPLIGKGLTETGAHAALKEKESRIADSMLASVIPKTHPLYNKCADVLVGKNLTADAMVAALAVVFEDNQRLSHELQQLKPLLESGGNAAAVLPSKVKEADEQRARADQLDAQLHQAKQEHREHVVLEDEHASKITTTLKSLSPADLKLLRLVLIDISASGADKQAGYFNPFVNLMENPAQIRARGAPILRELEAKGYKPPQPPVAAASAAAATPTAYVDLAGKEHIAGVAADEQEQAERLQELAGVVGFERGQ
jgi:hypothetical protein